MTTRRAEISRETKETRIRCRIDLDGTGTCNVATPIGMFTHMLTSLGVHAWFDLEFNATGDLEVDQHHLVEDSGLVLGQAIDKALGAREGIRRAGCFFYPLDEALALAAVDLGGRPYLQYRARFRRRYCGELDTDVLPDFFAALAQGMKANLVLRSLRGRSDHHRVESLFKALARALAAACERHPRGEGQVPSTKGTLTR